MASKRGKRAQRKNNSVWVIVGIAIVAVLAVGLVVFYGTNNTSSAQVSSAPVAPAPLDKCGSATCGNANAPVTLDVYADFQCPYCAQFEPELQQLAAQYIDTGKVKLVYHNFPIIGPESQTAAQAAECAGDQNQFWRFANIMFKRQGAENSGVFTADNLKRMAADAKLDTQAFNTCLDSGKYASTVSQQEAEGRQRGVQATPTFFINGQIHEGGVPYNQLVALINAALPQ
jgi:protein-disulfide isomerase